MAQGSRKKGPPLVVRPLSRGGGRPRPLRIFFDEALNAKKINKKVPITTKLEGGGAGKALVVGQLVEELFLRLSLSPVGAIA